MLTLENLRKEFLGKRILITGGTGSIGISLVQELMKFNPLVIRIFSNDENSIFEARKTFEKAKNVTYLVGDIRDKDRLMFAIRDIDIVYHAAAMKHVDICEYNPFDAIKTNVIGTSNIIEASLMENVSKFILISTDKATNPTSTLGASKLLAEKLTVNASSYKGLGKTNFSIVRFGNVIASRGSVFHIFLDQLKQKKSLTVTDSRMTRFIMSLSEAASLILRATVNAKDGEIFILKMPSVHILDLAKNLKEVYFKKIGKSGNSISINLAKVREGERLHEYLITSQEALFCHDMGEMYKITTSPSKKKISLNNFDSKTAPNISTKKLQYILGKLLDESITGK